MSINNGRIDSRTPTFPVYIAINEYAKRMEDELDLKLGDKIEVITDDGEYHDGWYYGKNIRTQEEGLYPVVFTKALPTEKSLKRRSIAAEMAESLTATSTATSDAQQASVNLNFDGKSISSKTQLEPTTGGKPVSLKNTMSDIDKALEELKRQSTNDLQKDGSEDLNAIIDVSNQDDHDLNTSQNTYQSGTVGLDVEKTLQANKSANTTIGSHTKNLNETTLGSENSDYTSKVIELQNVYNWTPAEVTKYFKKCGFDADSSSSFEKHKVSGEILLQLDLNYLKELEIDSFGTRFEIYKEIEAIKAFVNNGENIKVLKRDNVQNKRASTLMPAAYINPETFVQNQSVQKIIPSEKSIASEKSVQSVIRNSMGNTPEFGKEEDNAQFRNVSSSSSKPKPDPLNIVTNDDPLEMSTDIKVSGIKDQKMFTSPRKAPKPPSYPSPVQPPHSGSSEKKSAITSPKYKNLNTPQGKLFSSNVSSPQPANSNSSRYKFPQSGSNIMGSGSGNMGSSQNSASNSGSRRSSVYNSHKKNVSGGSFVDLFSKVALLSPNSHEDTRSSSEASNYGEKSTSSHAGQIKNLTKTHSRGSSVMNTKTTTLTHTKSNSVSQLRQTSQNTADGTNHKRNSSILSFLSGKTTERPISPVKSSASGRRSPSKNQSSKRKSVTKDQISNTSFNTTANTTAAATLGNASTLADTTLQGTLNDTFVDLEATPTRPSNENPSPIKLDDRRAVSAKDTDISAYFETKPGIDDDELNKRSVSEAFKGKAMRKLGGKPLSKQNTTAFVEGLRNIAVKDALLDADCSGWMSKKGSGTMGVWKTRFFTLHGTRLSYFANSADTKERGLIDITSHRVVPTKEDDKFVSLYAASTGKGRYCFKLIPPQPGSKKGLTFTQPRIHYFAVDTKDDMRAWMAALIKTTIDVDTDVPVVSSYSTPTVSLSKAQEMLTQAREESRTREDEYMNGENQDRLIWDQQNETSKADSKRTDFNTHEIELDDEEEGSSSKMTNTPTFSKNQIPNFVSVGKSSDAITPVSNIGASLNSSTASTPLENSDPFRSSQMFSNGLNKGETIFEESASIAASSHYSD